MGIGEKKGTRLSIMYKKQKELAVMSENWGKIYIIEIKIVSLSSLARVMEKKGD